MLETDLFGWGKRGMGERSDWETATPPPQGLTLPPSLTGMNSDGSRVILAKPPYSDIWSNIVPNVSVKVFLD